MGMSPRLEGLFAEARTIWAARQDLRDRFRSIESLGYWNWLMAEGWSQCPQLAKWLPTPPESLIGRVIGHGATTEDYLRSGLSDAQNIYEMLFDVATDVTRGGNLLDFGCGCGRIIRFVARLADTWTLFGADVDEEAIEWCQSQLDFASFSRIRPEPPLSFPDEHFTAIYSFSVFSHLPESLHRRWLEDLRRTLKPGGTLVATVMGRHCFERFKNSDLPPGTPGLAPAVLDRDARAFDTSGYVYYAYEGDPISLPEEDWQEGLYGMAFITDDYVRERWSELFEVVEIRFAPQGWQDYVALRRPR